MTDNKKYEVKKIVGGPNHGKYGVFKGNQLYKTWDRRGDATRDKNERNKKLGT